MTSPQGTEQQIGRTVGGTARRVVSCGVLGHVEGCDVAIWPFKFRKRREERDPLKGAYLAIDTLYELWNFACAVSTVGFRIDAASSSAIARVGSALIPAREEGAPRMIARGGRHMPNRQQAKG